MSFLGNKKYQNVIEPGITPSGSEFFRVPILLISEERQVRERPSQAYGSAPEVELPQIH